MEIRVRLLGAAILCALSFDLQAQPKPAEPTPPPPVPIADASANFDGRITEASRIVDADTKFKALRSIRNELTRTIDETKAQRSGLQDEIARLLAARKELLPPPNLPGFVEPTQEKIDADLAAARARVKSITDQLAALKPDDPSAGPMRTELLQAQGYLSNFEQYVDSLKVRKQFADKQAKDLEALDRKLESLRILETGVDKTLKKLIASQGGLDEEINDALRTDGQRNVFKSEIAFAFAILVAFVIGGFFFIAWKDETVRRAIFSGESGIQFLTLFSVVIAIILFGITGILESKELAALLGGLSGYILGRVTSK